MAKAKRAKVTGPMVACPGEAHRNPHIDGCMMCLDYTWGEVPLPFKLGDAVTPRNADDIGYVVGIDGAYVGVRWDGLPGTPRAWTHWTLLSKVVRP